MDLQTKKRAGSAKPLNPRFNLYRSLSYVCVVFIALLRYLNKQVHINKQLRGSATGFRCATLALPLRYLGGER